MALAGQIVSANKIRRGVHTALNQPYGGLHHTIKEIHLWYDNSGARTLQQLVQCQVQTTLRELSPDRDLVAA